jgi:hypothetical protein
VAQACAEQMCENNHLAKANRLVRSKQFGAALISYESALREAPKENRALMLRNRSYCLTNVQVRHRPELCRARICRN